MLADCVTVCQWMSCSPYFTVTGTHPLLPLDVAEATYLLPLLDAPLLTTNLIATCTVALQKQHTHLMKLMSNVYSAHIKATIHFEQEHASNITDYDFKLGDLVLIQNTTIEKSLNHKMCARYIGPLIVISRNRGGAYIIPELNSSVFDCLIATFQVIPYFVRQCIDIPPLDELINITLCQLHELEETTLSDPDKEDEDFTVNYYPSPDVDDDNKDWGQSTFQLGGRYLVNFSNYSFLCFCTHTFALMFIFAAFLSCLHCGYNLVCRKKGFTGNEAFWAFPLLKHLLFGFKQLIICSSYISLHCPFLWVMISWFK